MKACVESRVTSRRNWYDAMPRADVVYGLEIGCVRWCSDLLNERLTKRTATERIAHRAKSKAAVRGAAQLVLALLFRARPRTRRRSLARGGLLGGRSRGTFGGGWRDLLGRGRFLAVGAGSCVLASLGLEHDVLVALRE